MKTKHFTIQFIVLSSLFLFSCGKPIEKLVIISTNDIHGELNTFPRLATFVEGVRAADTAKVLLIDAGDRWTGNPFTDLAEKRGFPIIELMNTLGYDYSTIGNHEFDNGQQILSDRIADSKFQNLLCNVTVVDSTFPVLPSYMIVPVGGVKIALLGMVHNYENGHPDGKPEIFNGLEFTDPIVAAKTYKSLKDSADMFVAITHIGVRPDSLLAVAVPELDLIVGGHSHTVLQNGKRVGNTLITQTGSNLRYVGVTVITIQGNKVLSVVNSLVELDDFAPSPKFQQMVDGYNDNPELTKTIGSMANDMNKTEITNWMTDVIRRQTKTDIAFYNLGGIRRSSVGKGDISVADVFAIEPFNSVMYTFEMTPLQIKTLLLNKFNAKTGSSQGVDLSPSGVKYRVVRDANGAGTDIEFTPALTKSKYKVALSDYVSKAYIFDQQNGGVSTETLLTNVLINDLKQNSPIKSDSVKRVEI